MRRAATSGSAQAHGGSQSSAQVLPGARADPTRDPWGDTDGRLRAGASGPAVRRARKVTRMGVAPPLSPPIDTGARSRSAPHATLGAGTVTGVEGEGLAHRGSHPLPGREAPLVRMVLMEKIS